MANSILSSLTDLFSAFASEEEKKQEKSKKSGVPPMMTPEIPTQIVMPQPEQMPGSVVQQIPPIARMASDKSGKIDAFQASKPDPIDVKPSVPDMGYQGVPSLLDPSSGQMVPQEQKVPQFGIDPTDIRSMEGMGKKEVPKQPEVEKPRGFVSVDLDRLDPRNKNRAERLASIPQGGDEYGDIGIESRAIVDGKPGPAVGNVANAPLDFSQQTPPPMDDVPEKPVTSLQQTSQVLGQGTQAIEDNNVTNNLPKITKDDLDDNNKIKEDSPWYKTVFSNIGSYLGDAFSSTMNDPVVKRALVSYLASRAVGTSASGAATFAGEVLQKGWEQQADLEAAAGKAAQTAAAATAKDRVIDRTKIHTLFNSGDNSQLNGYYSKDSTIFEPSDPIAFAKAYGIEPNENGLFPSQYPASSLTGYGLRPKTSEDLTRKDQLNLVVDSVKDETANKLDYFTLSLEQRGFSTGSEEYNQALAAHRKLLGEDGIRRAITTYADRLPSSVDISDPRVSTAFNQAIVDFEEAIASGRAVGNADLVGLIEQRFITHDLATKQIPSQSIRVTDEAGQPLSKDEGLVGSNAWSRTNKQLDNLMVTARQINKENKTQKPTLYAGLSSVFNSLPDSERAYWYKQSEISGEDKMDAASPLMLWLNASMTQSSSNNDRAMGAMTPDTLVNSLFN